MKPKRSTAVLGNSVGKLDFARHLKHLRGVSAAIGKISMGKTTVPGKKGERR